MESDSSETNLVLVRRRARVTTFCKVYWRTLTLVAVPLALLPLLFVGVDYAYVYLYVFAVTLVYWIADVLHPSVTALLPVALFTAMGMAGQGSVAQAYVYLYVFAVTLVYWIADVLNPSVTALLPVALFTAMGMAGQGSVAQVCVRNIALECLGVLMLMVAVETSGLHRRLALKLLVTFGCTHYRLSFLVFFSTMFSSMWISKTLSCCLMMPLVKAVLAELEKMGLLEVNQTFGKDTQISDRHEKNVPRPSDFTVYYFLGIAYSSTIGGMSTIVGSKTNQIFKMYFETVFPVAPRVELPQLLLLTLPAALVLETLLYLWMNFFFLGMFRRRSEVSVQMTMSEEEEEHVRTLLSGQYQLEGHINFHQAAVCAAILLAALLQVLANDANLVPTDYHELHSHVKMLSPSLICAMVLFVTPVNLDFIRYFRRDLERYCPLPSTPSRACLSWDDVTTNMLWSVLFITGSSSMMFEGLRLSGMTSHVEVWLSACCGWSPPAMALLVILVCKLLAECAGDACVLSCLLPHVVRMSVSCCIHPQYLATAAVLSCALPFHLSAGALPNAMVAAYVHVHPWTMLYLGLGPSLMSAGVVWFTVTTWSRAIWSDLSAYPDWAHNNLLNITSLPVSEV